MVKFTDDAAPAGGPASGDLIPLVDISDTTDDAAGSSKTDTIQNVAGAVSLTDLADVDTDKLQTPLDGDTLTFDGTDWNAETPAGGGGQSPYSAIVAASGGDYTTLGAALSAASAGWVIKVMPGTYSESAISTATHNITIVGSGMKSSIIDMAGNDWRPTGDYWVYKDFQILTSTGDIDLEQSTGVSHLNMWFETTSNNTTNGMELGCKEGSAFNCTYIHTGTPTNRVMLFNADKGRYANCFFYMPSRTSGGSSNFAWGGDECSIIGSRFWNESSASSSVFLYIGGTENKFVGCEMFDIWGSVGTWIDATGADNQFTACNMQGGVDNVIFDMGGFRTSVIGCHIASASAGCVYFDMNNQACMVANNVMLPPSSSTGDMFNIASSDCHVTNNICSIQAFNSATVASGTDNVVIGNNMQGVTLTDSGTNTQAAYNT